MLQTPYSGAGCCPPGLHAILRLTTADQSGRHVPGLRLTTAFAVSPGRPADAGCRAASSRPGTVEELSAMTDNQEQGEGRLRAGADSGRFHA